MSLLDIGLENEEGYEEFYNLCAELNGLDDNPVTTLDPKKRLHIMDEMRHLIKPGVYKEIMNEYK